MSEELVFYTNPMSRGRIVRWMLEEAGATYETRVLGYGTTMKSAEYLAINPMGKVPAIQHKGRVVTECAAICAYLADAFPDAGLAPPADDRGDYYRWLFFFAGPVEAAVGNRALNVDVPEDKERTVGYGNFRTVMDMVEHAVSRHPFIAGEKFSAADVYCGSHVGWGLQFKTLEERPGLAEYWGRLQQREALQRAAALDDALLDSEQG